MKLKMQLKSGAFNRKLESMKKKGSHFDAIDAQVQQTIIDFFVMLGKETPVVTGNLKGNWDLSLNTPKFRIYGSKEDPREFTSAWMESYAKLVKWTMARNQKVFITNSVDYAEDVNEGSRNAPRGMTDPAISAFVSKYPFVKVS